MRMGASAPERFAGNLKAVVGRKQMSLINQLLILFLRLKAEGSNKENDDTIDIIA